jgi:hypothetical protein
MFFPVYQEVKLFPVLTLPEGVKNFPKSPPPSPSPVKGEGYFFLFEYVALSPRGRGWAEGRVCQFLHTLILREGRG